jgi:hypothetical protein
LDRLGGIFLRYEINPLDDRNPRSVWQDGFNVIAYINGWSNTIEFEASNLEN